MTRASLGVILTLVLGGCHAAAPGFHTAADRMADSEALAGALAAPAVEAQFGGVVRHPDAERRMEAIARRLLENRSAPRGRYQYRLLGSEKNNAVSLPGRIYITVGLYRWLESDELLAAVLAHELAHWAAKDHFKPRCSCSAEALERESDADRRGAAMLNAVRIPPRAMLDVLDLVRESQPPGWAQARTHALVHELQGRQPKPDLTTDNRTIPSKPSTAGPFADDGA